MDCSLTLSAKRLCNILGFLLFMIDGIAPNGWALIRDNVPQTTDLYWVDFTMEDIWQCVKTLNAPAMLRRVETGITG